MSGIITFVDSRTVFCYLFFDPNLIAGGFDQYYCKPLYCTGNWRKQVWKQCVPGLFSGRDGGVGGWGDEACPQLEGVLRGSTVCAACFNRSMPLSFRSCKSGASICRWGGVEKIIFAWALNASGIHLPEGVGLQVGPTQNINYVVVQIHYGHPEGMM